MPDITHKTPRNVLSGVLMPYNTDVQQDSRSFHEPLRLTWSDLIVWKRRKLTSGLWTSDIYEDIQILKGVSGEAVAGNLIAIMGASGAGKTTLLAAISSRDKSQTSGGLMLNGNRVDSYLITRISGFVPQYDLAVEELNVMEHMQFMARLMMDASTTTKERQNRIDELLSELYIQKCIHTKLCDLSGGERKRVALAVQLLNDPPILFCDEPTTGLDSWSTNSVVIKLRNLASIGKLVICSIHQPASGVFEMFHQVILLAGGRVAFHGPISECTRFFNSHGLICPVGYNEAEYYVSQLAIHPGSEKESYLRIQKLCDDFQRSKTSEIIKKYYDEDKSPITVCSIFDSGGIEESFVACLCSVPFLGVLENLDQQSVQDLQGLLYLMVTETIYLFIYSVYITFPSELPVLLRETANGLYSPGPYYLSKMTLWLPGSIIKPILFTTLIFWSVGLKGGFTTWLCTTLVIILCANFANAYGSLLSSTFERIETASIISVPYELIGTMYSGMFLNLESVPFLLKLIKYISPFYYGLETISILQWNEIEAINCVNKEGMPCIASGKDALAKYGYSNDNFYTDIIGLFTMYFISHFISYLMVTRRSRRAPVY